MNLSNYQRAILDAYINTRLNIIVNARAGSGKTTTLMLLAEHVHSAKAIFVAFNVHIAKELDKRLKLVGSSMVGKTIHSLGYGTCVKYLTKNGMKVDTAKYSKLARAWVTKQPQYKSYEMIEEATDSLRKLVDFTRLTKTGIGDYQRIEDIAGEHGIPADSEIINAVAGIIAEGAEIRYCNLNGIDYTDMLYLPYYHSWAYTKYDEIFGDEIQDWNNIQVEFISQSLKPNGRVVLVGDPDQSIMGFAGANTDAFSVIKENFGCTEYPLNYCYRCGYKIVQAAKRYVPEIESPEGAHEGEIISLDADVFFKTAKSGDAVLCRFTAPLVTYCLRFLAEGRTARVRGRNVGATIASHARRAAKLGDWEEYPAMINEHRRKEVLRLTQLGKDQMWIDNINDVCDCLEVMWSSRFNSIKEFETYIMSLFSDDELGITLSTVHRSKGLEWSDVYILEPTKLPFIRRGMSDEQIKQELNTAYVGTTRAINKLAFVNSKTP